MGVLLRRLVFFFFFFNVDIPCTPLLTRTISCLIRRSSLLFAIFSCLLAFCNASCLFFCTRRCIYIIHSTSTTRVTMCFFQPNKSCCVVLKRLKYHLSYSHFLFLLQSLEFFLLCGFELLFYNGQLGFVGFQVNDSAAGVNL